MSKDPLAIDLSNPDELAARMPEIQRLYAQKLSEQRALEDQVELLRRLLGAFFRRQRRDPLLAAPVPTDNEKHAVGKIRRRRAAPAQDRAVYALEQAGGSAMGPTSLYKFMLANGMEAPKDANVLGANLWDAWHAGRIMRAPNGVYTPLDGTGRTEWDRPLTDYYYAAELGMPVPGSWPG